MNTASMGGDAIRDGVELNGMVLEVFRTGGAGTAICAAHPADPFDAQTARLLGDTSGRPVVVVNPPGIGSSTGAVHQSLEKIVDDIEQTRRRLGIGPWVFWGMSGGGWLAQLYAHRYPEALAGLIIESACACFRERLADPACALSPFFPAWHDALAAADLLREGSHADPYDGPTDWIDVAGAGAVFRKRGGPALLVSPMALTPAMKAMMPAFLRLDTRSFLPAVRLPTLVLAGTADPVVPLHHVRAVHQAISGSTFVAVEGASHVPTAARHPQVARAVQAFLNQ